MAEKFNFNCYTEVIVEGSRCLKCKNGSFTWIPNAQREKVFKLVCNYCGVIGGSMNLNGLERLFIKDLM